jgi:hypothetical protein
MSNELHDLLTEEGDDSILERLLSYCNDDPIGFPVSGDTKSRSATMLLLWLITPRGRSTLVSFRQKYDCSEDQTFRETEALIDALVVHVQTKIFKSAAPIPGEPSYKNFAAYLR